MSTNTVKPLPRITVMNIEFEKVDNTKLYKAKFIKVINFIFIIQVISWVVASLVAALGHDTHYVKVLCMVPQMYAATFLFYYGCRWGWAWIFGGKTMTQRIG